MAEIPVPLPQSYIQGLDTLRHELNSKGWSYLAGEWRLGGWWYYYLAAAIFKVPLGNLTLFGLAVLCSIRRWRESRQNILEDLCLLVPALLIWITISMNTGFNHHFRYMLPAQGLLCVWITTVFSNGSTTPHLKVLLLVLVLSSALSSLFAWPHNLSYFNELAGGPHNGTRYLGGHNSSMIDCGQDMLFIKHWAESHPHAQPLFIATHAPVEPYLLGMRAIPWSPRKNSLWLVPDVVERHELADGYYAISVNNLIAPGDDFSCFRDMPVYDLIGYSTRVFRITSIRELPSNSAAE
jgi:hypothetical protein